jgi:hypothetical protein
MKNAICWCVTVLLRSLLILVIGGSLASCKPKPSTVLHDTSCEPPCWHNIIPGKSTKTDVLLLLPNIPEVDPNSIEDTAITTGGVYSHIKWQFASGGGDFGIIYFENGVVSTITISPKKGALTLEDTIKILGEPEFTYAYKERGEIDRMLIFLLYPTKGYTLLYNSGRFRRSSALIEPEHPIEFVNYIDLMLFYELVTSHPFIRINRDLVALQENMRPWRGYGEIFFFEK